MTETMETTENVSTISQSDRDNGDYTKYLYHQPIQQRERRLQQKILLPSASLTIETTAILQNIYTFSQYNSRGNTQRIPLKSASLTTETETRKKNTSTIS